HSALEASNQSRGSHWIASIRSARGHFRPHDRLRFDSRQKPRMDSTANSVTHFADDASECAIFSGYGTGRDGSVAAHLPGAAHPVADLETDARILAIHAGHGAGAASRPLAIHQAASAGSSTVDRSLVYHRPGRTGRVSPRPSTAVPRPKDSA